MAEIAAMLIIGAIVATLAKAELGMRSLAVVLSIVLICSSVAMAGAVLGQALGGSRYVDWGTNPIVWWGELALAACFGVLAAAAVVLIARITSQDSVDPALAAFVTGFGFVAVGLLGIAAGWLGLQVATIPGYDVLSRGEPVLILGGVAAIAFGVLVAVVSAVISWLTSGSDAGPE